MSAVDMPAGGAVTSPESHEITFAHAGGDCRIVVRAGIMADIGAMMAGAGLAKRVLVVTNPLVHRLYGGRLERSLARAGIAGHTFFMPDGEVFKSVPVASAAWSAALEAGLDRTSVVVALGGGVACDLGGFVASTYMRGIGFVQVPTTLLAQVDASVGGKVAVNLPKAKNVVGAFHQPRAVFADPVALATLERRDMASGLSEMVKHGAIADKALFERLESLRDCNLSDPEVMAELVAWNIRLKLAVVGKDETESGPRALLNFGHTIGHAVESATGYALYRHGEAVAIGMSCAADISRAMGLLGEPELERLTALLRSFGLPVSLDGLSADAITGEMVKDKKAVGGAPRFVLLEGIGRARYGVEVPHNLIRETLLRKGATS